MRINDPGGACRLIAEIAVHAQDVWLHAQVRREYDWNQPVCKLFRSKRLNLLTTLHSSAQPTGNDDAAFLLGLDSEDAIPILSSSETSVFWLHVVGTSFDSLPGANWDGCTPNETRFAATVLTGATVGSLILPPSYLGGEDSILFLV